MAKPGCCLRSAGWTALVVGLLSLVVLARDTVPPRLCCNVGPLVPTPIATVGSGRTVPSAGSTAAPQATPSPLDQDITGGAWRYGFGVSAAADPAKWGARLGAGWYLDWSAKTSPAGQQLVHWRMIRIHPDGTRPALDELPSLAARNPGQIWIIGNEPDVIWQDDVTAERYAEAYHDVYLRIKAADPTAKVAVGAVAEPTPLRLAYLDRVLDTYQARYGRSLPADIWTVHDFILPEKKGSWGIEIPPGFDVQEGVQYGIKDHARTDLFEGQLIAFRSWMAERGYRGVPLALTEFGILMPASYGFPPSLVEDYLTATFDILRTLKDPATGLVSDGDRLVQSWAWFSLADPTYSTGDLADLDNDRLTGVGQAYRRYVDQHGG